MPRRKAAIRKIKKLKSQLLQRQWESEVTTTLDSIISILPSIHKISLFSKSYRYDDVIKSFGRFKVIDQNNMREYFRTLLIRNYKKFYLLLLINPNPLIAQHVNLKLHIHHARHNDPSPADLLQFLKFIDEKLPEMNISYVEYALQYFCDHHENVQLLHDVIRRVLYIPYVRKFSEQIGGVDIKQGRTALTTHYHNYRLYERGDDMDRTEGDWLINKVNNLKFERIVNRQTLQNYGVRKISDLIVNPLVYEMLITRINFRKFKKRGYPKPYDSFMDFGVKGTFTDYYQVLKLEEKNPRKYHEDIEELRPLKKLVEEALLRAKDNFWDF